MNTITFNPKWLKAAATIAARNDIRDYLNGVLVEVFSHEARLVATDGRRMVIFRKLAEGATPGVFIIPNAILDLLKPDEKSKQEVDLLYNPDDWRRVSMDYKGVSINFAPIDGKFPDYSQTMNKATKPSGEVAYFNPDYAVGFKRCVQTAFGSKGIYYPIIWHNGSNPAAVTYEGREEFFGIVMPMRMGETYNPPKWTLPPAEESSRKRRSRREHRSFLR